MQQESPSILDYSNVGRMGAKRSIISGFVCRWLVGIVLSAVGIAALLGGTGVLVPILAAGAAVASLPVFAVLRLITSTSSMGNTGAFFVALVCCPIIAFGLLVIAFISFHGC